MEGQVIGFTDISTSFHKLGRKHPEENQWLNENDPLSIFSNGFQLTKLRCWWMKRLRMRTTPSPLNPDWIMESSQLLACWNGWGWGGGANIPPEIYSPKGLVRSNPSRPCHPPGDGGGCRGACMQMVASLLGGVYDVTLMKITTPTIDSHLSGWAAPTGSDGILQTAAAWFPRSRLQYTLCIKSSIAGPFTACPAHSISIVNVIPPCIVLNILGSILPTGTIRSELAR